MVSLADLSGKLGQFIGQSDAVTKAINDAITAIINSHDEFKSLRNSPSSPAQSSGSVPAELINVAELLQKIQHFKKEIASLEKRKSDQNPSLSSEDSRLLSSHQSKLQSLQRLKSLNESLSSLNKQQSDNCKNLLTNLTDGLEKFLGFNPTSKGYSGEGIVYSDLDRLCDGVMSFLLKCMECSQTLLSFYYPNITQTIKDLEGKIGTGRGVDGFAQAIERVQQGLEGYESGMEKLTNVVVGDQDDPKSKIKELEEQIDTNILQVKELESQGFDAAQSKWYQTVTKDLYTKVSNLANAINALDPELNKKLSGDLGKISTQLENFEKGARRDEREMRELGSKVSEQLKELEEQVNAYAEDQGDVCIEGLKKEFDDNIQTPIENVKEALLEVQRKLQQWSEKATSAVKTAMEKVEEIVNKLDGRTVGSRNNEERKDVTKAAHGLHGKARCLLDAIDGAKKTLSDRVNEAIHKVTELDDDLRTDLTTLKDKIKTAIWNHVQQVIMPDFDNIKQNVVDESGKGEIYTSWNSLKEAITGRAAGLVGSSPSNSNLSDMVAGVATYAAEFKKGQFGKIVNAWVKEIIEKNVIVRDWFGYYVKHPDNKSLLQPGYNAPDMKNFFAVKTNEIAGVFESKLNFQISQAAIDPGTSIQQNIDAVKSGINRFVDAIVKKLTYPGIDAFVSVIAGDIKTHLVPDVFSTDPKQNTYLEEAVKLILVALISTARNAGEAVDYFASDKASKIKTNLENAIEKVKEITNQVNPDQPGGRIESALATVLGQVKSLKSALTQPTFQNAVYAKLNAEIGFDAGGKIITLTDKNFTNYNKHLLKQSKGFTSIPIGKLPSAINAIKEEVNQYFMDKNGNAYITSQNLNSALSAVDAKVKTFCDAVKSLINRNGAPKDNSMQSHLDQLNNLITKNVEVTISGGSLNGTVDGLRKIQDELGYIIGTEQGQGNKDNVNKILMAAKQFNSSTIDRELGKCVSGINGFLSQEVTDKIDNIKRDALNNYVNSAKQQLEELRSYVTERKKSLQTIVEEDKTGGTKGLLKELQGETDPPTDKNIPGVKTSRNWLEALRSITNLKQSEKFTTLSQIIKHYLHPVFDYIIKQVRKTFPDSASSPGATRTPHPHMGELENVESALTALLEHLIDDSKKVYNFEHTFDDYLKALIHSLDTLSPKKFGAASCSVLDAMKEGLMNFGKQLKCAYVSTYSGATTNWKKQNNPDKEKCAKVCLTTVCMLYSELTDLRLTCNKSQQMQINLSNGLGQFLKSCGYDVSADAASQNGELRNCVELDGFTVRAKITKEINGANSGHILKCKPLENTFNIMTLLSCFCEHLSEYYRVCHLPAPSSKKHPTSIYDMLTWLCGLTYNPVYDAIKLDGFAQLFDKPEKPASEDSDSAEPVVLVEDDASLPAYPETITAIGLSTTLAGVCHYAYETLIAILGHGHADGVYACEFNINAQGFVYPADFNTLICMIFNILKLLYQQLYFLYTQCCYSTKLGGWCDCHYGRYVGGSSWNCNEKLCANLECKLSGNQKGNLSANQNTKQTCDQHPKCGVKSPLQSFLEDGLVGFLPHPVTSTRGKLECPVKGHLNIPCKAPMGFADISQTASHVKNGKYLRRVLSEFCGSVESPLTKLCSQLNCLLPTAPKSLGDMFAFYFSFLNDWCGKRHTGKP
ncbi:hypothetical protein, conserved [Babesia ovata]|uniref:Extracellular matrix-binding ebh n=1 Tax=Babesia ovata TaxID=189622 RepID=A0A2H6KJX0_9APIC|nr:uncharacterized protein BOVATA_047860 [Babesia ovata]GBE63293.1 hypothetical protein, conserved [Babesia ovata]